MRRNRNSLNVSNSVIGMLNVRLFHGQEIDLVFPFTTVHRSHVSVATIGQIGLIDFFYNIRSLCVVEIPSIVIILPSVIIFEFSICTVSLRRVWSSLWRKRNCYDFLSGSSGRSGLSFGFDQVCSCFLLLRYSFFFLGFFFDGFLPFTRFQVKGSTYLEDFLSFQSFSNGACDWDPFSNHVRFK